MASSCQTPQSGSDTLVTASEDLSGPSEISATDSRPIIKFNHTGGIVFNKAKLLKRSLTLLKIQVGPDYESWKVVPQAMKDDMWETLQNEFRITSYRKEEVLKDMNGQFKTWKRNIRAKYFTGLGATEIKALKDKVPQKEKIKIHNWNSFIEHEATTKKLEEREIKKKVRAKKIDVHCLGRKSYAEKADEMKEKDPARRSPNRTEVYIEARNEKKTGKPHPNTADTIQKILEMVSDQSSNTLDNDPLTRALGKDTRGTVRGIGPVCKGKVLATQPLKLDLDRVLHKHQSLEHVVYGIQGQLSSISEQLANMQKLQVPQISSNPNNMCSTPESSTFPIASPSSTPSSGPIRDVKLVNMSNKVVATARTVNVPIGAIVHHRKMLGHETKVELVSVEEDEYDTIVYLGSQGSATTLGEAVGGYLVWPTCFIVG